MQLGSVTPSATQTPAPASDPRGNGGIRGAIGDFIRGSGAGYAAATKSTSVQSDKATIHPFETVSTITSSLKNATKNVKGVNKVTGALHTIGGFALLIASSNVSSGLKTPGDSGYELAAHVADLIDGKDTAPSFSLGWGIVTDAKTGAQEMTQSGLGATLAALGAK